MHRHRRWVPRRSAFSAALALAVVATLLGGCGGFRDIDKRFLVVAVGVDAPEKEGHKYKVTVKLAIPHEKLQMGKSQSIVRIEEANSITEAIRQIQAKVDKELDFAHVRLVVIGRPLVEREKIAPMLDWFLRRRDISMITWVATGQPDALSVLKMEPSYERLPGNAFFMALGQRGGESEYLVSAELFDAYRRQREIGMDPIMPIIEVLSKDEFRINTSIVLSGGRFAAALNPQETRLYNIVSGQAQQLDITVDETPHRFQMLSQQLNVDYSIHTPETGRPYMKMNVRITGVVEETEQLRVESLGAYEKMTERAAERRIRAFLRVLQEKRIDPVGFGLRYRSNQWGRKPTAEEWERIYADLEFRVAVNVDLYGKGVLK